MKRRNISLFVFFFMLFGLISVFFSDFCQVQAASPKLNRKSATLWIGDTLQLKVKNTKKKVKWSSGKKSVATVSSKGKVKAKKAGETVITAKSSGKKSISVKLQ